MFWLSRPPYLRRATAVVIVLAALAIELRPTTTERLPVAATDLPAGATVTEGDVRWMDVAPGLVEPIELPSVLARDVPAGAPLSTADIDPSSIDLPSDWLQIELEVPPATRQGARIIAVLSPVDLGQPATGVVAGTPVDTGFEVPAAMVAFAPEDAVAVARATAEGTVTVLVGR